MKQTLKKTDDIPFTQIANLVLNDQKISWKAKGLFSYLYSKPQDWDFSVHRIKNDSTDGMESLLSGIKELEMAGYLTRKRLGNGRMQYQISYEPDSENPNEPDSENPNNGFSQQGVSRTVSNIELQSNKDVIKNIDFAEFWNLYPRKVEKKKAEARWNHLKKSDQEAILADLPKRKLSDKWQKDGGQYIPYPLTYLNGERWNDEIVQPTAPTTTTTGKNWTQERIEDERERERERDQARQNRLVEQRADPNSPAVQKFRAMKEKFKIGH